MAREWTGGLMGLWDILHIWGLCPDPESFVSFWGKGRVLFSVSGIPDKQGFQGQIPGPGAWITPGRIRIWDMGVRNLLCGLLDVIWWGFV